jgi:glutathione S-transferase-like protein
LKVEMHLLGDDIYFLAANQPTLLDLWAHAFVAEIIAPPIESPLKEASAAHSDLTDHFQRLQARLYT